MNKAVADTGPLLHLKEINKLSLLSLFPAINISSQVKAELEDHLAWSSLEKAEEVKITVRTVANIGVKRENRRWRSLGLSSPDLSVLVLMRRFPKAMVLTDDLRLRRAVVMARRQVTGSVGIIVRGYRQKYLSYGEMVTAMDRLFNDSSLYLSRSFKNRVLELVRELEEESS